MAEWEKACTATRAPASWAAATASRSTGRDHRGSKSESAPLDRSIQSPTSLTHPSDREAWSARTRGRSRSSSTSTASPRM